MKGNFIASAFGLNRSLISKGLRHLCIAPVLATSSLNRSLISKGLRLNVFNKHVILLCLNRSLILKVNEKITKHCFVRVQENLHFRKFCPTGYNGLNRKS